MPSGRALIKHCRDTRCCLHKHGPSGNALLGTVSKPSWWYVSVHIHVECLGGK